MANALCAQTSGRAMNDAKESAARVGRARAETRHARERKTVRWAVPVIGLALVLAAGVAIWWWLMPGEPIQYDSLPVTRGNIVPTVIASGTVNPVITVQVGTYVSGVIQARYCDYNTKVTAGQLCAKIDPRPYQVIVDQDRANLAIAKAQLEKDKASLAYAKITYERNLRLVKTHAVSQAAADNAKSLFDQAKAQVDLDAATIGQRQAALHAAEINLDYTDIRSPVDGTVVSRNVETGQTVAASFQTPTLFLIATDLTKMQVDTNVSESDVGALKVGDTASFTVLSYGGRVFNGEVTQIRKSPQTIQNVVTYDAVVSVPNTDLALMPGMTATVNFITGRRDNVLRVPDQALHYVPGGLVGLPHVPPESGTARVYVLRNGKPVAEDIDTGLDDGTNTEVVKGALKPGDAVVIGEHLATAAQTRRSGPRAPRL